MSGLANSQSLCDKRSHPDHWWCDLFVSNNCHYKLKLERATTTTTTKSCTIFIFVFILRYIINTLIRQVPGFVGVVSVGSDPFEVGIAVAVPVAERIVVVLEIAARVVVAVDFVAAVVAIVRKVASLYTHRAEREFE